MSKKFIYLLLLILIPYVIGAEDLSLRDSLVLDLTINSSVNAKFDSSKGSLDYVEIQLNYVISNTDNQKIFMVKTTPQAVISDKTVFEWKNPKDFPLTYELKSSLETSSKRKEISKKVDFPIKELPAEIYEYTRPTEMIDVNEDIKRLASKLSENEDDLYVVAFTLAVWANKNIKYDLSSAGADAVEKSSWVLKNKVGVCDEITNLFISMCRSLGVPSKFVTGMSYTNDPQFKTLWGLHGWAEVYFPDYGWVPFDPTYGELGFLDPGHIKLKDSFDSNKSSTEYKWQGRRADLTPNPLLMEVTVLKKGSLTAPPFDIGIQVFDDSVGFGSYNYVEAKLSNPNDYYVTGTLALSLPSEIEIIDDKSFPVILTPHDKKSVFWKIKVPLELKDDYRYTFPAAVTLTQQNHTVETEFEAAKSNNAIDYETIADIVKNRESVKEQDDGVSFFCSALKNEADIDEKIGIDCTISSNRPENINDLSVCLDGSCKKISVSSNKEGKVSFEKSFNQSGYRFFSITAKNKDVSKIFFVNIMILDTPKIDITNLDYPSLVKFDETFKISFVMAKKSYAEPKNAKVTVYTNKNKESWNIEKMDGIVPFSVELSGKFLKFNENKIKIVATFEDDKGKVYSLEKDFTLTLDKTKWTQKIEVVLNQFSFWIDRMINK